MLDLNVGAAWFGWSGWRYWSTCKFDAYLTCTLEQFSLSVMRLVVHAQNLKAIIGEALEALEALEPIHFVSKSITTNSVL